MNEGLRTPIGRKREWGDITLRRALATDENDVLRLTKQLFGKSAPLGYSDERARSMFRKLLHRKGVFHVVAERDGRVCASVVAYFLDIIRFGRRIFLEDFIVDLRYRRMGLGSQMLRYLIDLAERTSCTAIILHTARSNSLAQKFYKRNGFTELFAYRKNVT